MTPVGDGATAPHGRSFFTTSSMFTFGGATFVTYFIPNILKVQFAVDPQTTAWIALGIAEAICLVGAFTPRPAGSVVQALLVAIVNGFLVFGAASGTSHTVAAVVQAEGPATSPRTAAEDTPAPAPSFLTPWP